MKYTINIQFFFFHFLFKITASKMTKSKSHRKPILHITYPTGVKDITQDLPKDELVRRLKVSVSKGSLQGKGF